MSHSESSSDVKPEYQTAHGEKITDKNKTTDTDFYFNKIANPIKIIKDQESETSELDSSMSISSNKSTKSNRSDRSDRSDRSEKSRSDKKSYSESRPNYEEIPVFKKPSSSPKNKFNDNENSPNYSNVEVKQLTVQEIRMKKIELLRKLCEIKSKGFTLSKEYDFNSALEEMEYEYELLKSFADKRNGDKVEECYFTISISYGIC
jgi:hypothetical protein